MIFRIGYENLDRFFFVLTQFTRLTDGQTDGHLSRDYICQCSAVKITVIVIINKKCSLSNEEEFVKAVVLFRGFSIPSVVFKTLKSNTKIARRTSIVWYYITRNKCQKAARQSSSYYAKT